MTTTETPTTAPSTPSSLMTTSILAPAPPPTVVTTTAAITTPVPTQTQTMTTTVAAAPAPYEGMPCSPAEINQETADGTLYCSPMGPQPSWQDLTHRSRPAVAFGSGCAEPGARARVVQTDGIATCQADLNGNLVWIW